MAQVFISHKTEDYQSALDAKSFLNNRGIEVYLAVLDDIIKNEKDVSSYLRKKIETHPNLLVVMTDKTQLSWWVPFEVGIATECDKKIATAFYFSKNKDNLPSFLKKWPLIDERAKFERYAELIKKDRTYVLNEANRLEKSATISSATKARLNQSQRTSDVFHEVLKASFGQDT